MSLQTAHSFRGRRCHDYSLQEKKSNLGIQECGINAINEVNNIYLYTLHPQGHQVLPHLLLRRDRKAIHITVQ